MRAALYCYTWDLAADAQFLERVAGMGISQLNMAATYHAGWFLHPAPGRRRAFMPEDGVCYFRPRSELYAATRLKPVVSRLCDEQDYWRLASDGAADHGLDLVAWTVGTHNTALGLLQPQCAVTNCFGDVYPHALCPADPDVRAYLEALCRDLSTHFKLRAIQPESFGYLGWRHGHHHERDLTGLTDAEARLMNLCFHPASCLQAEAAGVDASRLRAGVCELLNEVLDTAPLRAASFPRMWADFCERLPELQPYLAVCRATEDAVMQGVRGAMEPSTGLHLGGYNAALADEFASFGCGVYGQSAEQAATTVRAARESVPQAHRLNVGMRLGNGVPADAQEMRDILVAVSEAGADTVVFYNASESPPAMLRWIQPALEGLIT